MTRQEIIDAFLTKAGWGDATRSFLAGDASLRSYDRVFKEGKTAVLMDAPPPENPHDYLPAQLVLVDRFILVDTILRKLGVHSPEIYAQDIENGLLLLEDLGDNSFTRLLDSGYDARKLYKLATESLIKTHSGFAIAQEHEQVYDDERMMADIRLLPQWVVKYVSKIELTPDEMAEYDTIWRDLISQMHEIPRGYALYDYHVDNLILTPDDTCGVIDFQDIRKTAATYDIMTLLEDERRYVPSDIKAEMLDLYFEAFPELNTPRIRSLSNLVALQRHIKVVGQFTRYWFKDGKDKYVRYVPFVWTLIENCLKAPECERLKAWIDKYVPASLRQIDLTKDM
ncbi:MAG: phosphotransferase [Alphaproteobacteria bacterium]|nr:phosphotransferase [Alphaproteobacteria bacterium]